MSDHDDTRPLPPPPAYLRPPPAGSPAPGPPPPSVAGGPGRPAPPSVAPGAPTNKRSWLVPTAVGVVALLVGIGLGAVSAQSSADETKKELASTTAQRDDLQAQLDDRAAQLEADQAAAQRVQSEKDAASQKAAADQAAAEKAAADKVAADQAAAAKAATDQAAAAAVADAARNTIPGSGIFEIGGDKNPGTYRTSGPVDRSCYYAVLSSPNASGVDNIIDNNNIQGPGIVTLQAGQFFETSRCADWTRS